MVRANLGGEQGDTLVDERVGGLGVAPRDRAFDAGFVAPGISGEPPEKFVLTAKFLDRFKAVPDVGVAGSERYGATLREALETGEDRGSPDLVADMARTVDPASGRSS